MRAEALLDRGQGGAVQLRAVGVGLHVTDEGPVRVGQCRPRRAGVDVGVGMAVRPAQVAARAQFGQRFHRVLGDVARQHPAQVGAAVTVVVPVVGVGGVVAVVHRGPHRPVGGDRQPGAVADPAGEHLRRTTTRRHPQDRGPLRGGAPVFDRDVAGGADADVDRTVRTDRDTLQGVRVRPLQVRALGVRQPVEHHPGVADPPVGVAVGLDPVALRHVQGGAGEGDPVRLVQPPQQGLLGGGAVSVRGRGEDDHVPGTGPRHQQPSVRSPGQQPGPVDPGPQGNRPAARGLELARGVERCRRQLRGYAQRRRLQGRGRRGYRTGRCRRHVRRGRPAARRQAAARQQYG